jgi:hypothetical protein
MYVFNYKRPIRHKHASEANYNTHKARKSSSWQKRTATPQTPLCMK